MMRRQCVFESRLPKGLPQGSPLYTLNVGFDISL